MAKTAARRMAQTTIYSSLTLFLISKQLPELKKTFTKRESSQVQLNLTAILFLSFYN
jgi:hypothetical protein